VEIATAGVVRTRSVEAVWNHKLLGLAVENPYWTTIISVIERVVGEFVSRSIRLAVEGAVRESTRCSPAGVETARFNGLATVL